MGTSFLDWLGRVVMLVLAGMITLSIIGAIAAIPSGSVGERLVAERGARPSPPPQPDRARPAPPPGATSRPQAAPPAAVPARRTVVAAPAPPPPDPLRWLETIAYALIALAGIAAFATILQLRSLADRRRLADALEDLARR